MAINKSKTKEKSQLKAYFRKYPNPNSWQDHPFDQFKRELMPTAFQAVRNSIDTLMKLSNFIIYGKNTHPEGNISVKHYMTILLRVASAAYHTMYADWYNRQGYDPVDATEYDFKTDPRGIMTKYNLKNFKEEVIYNEQNYRAAIQSIETAIKDAIVGQANALGNNLQIVDGKVTRFDDPEVAHIKQREAVAVAAAAAERERIANKGQPKALNLQQPIWQPQRANRYGQQGNFGLQKFILPPPPSTEFTARPAGMPRELADLFKKKA
jgi:hypothetical protein